MSWIEAKTENVAALSLFFGSHLGIDISGGNEPAIGLWYIFLRFHDEERARLITPAYLDKLCAHLCAEMRSRDRPVTRTVKENVRLCLDRAEKDLHDPKLLIQGIATAVAMLAPDGEEGVDAMAFWDKIMNLTAPDEYKRDAMLQKIFDMHQHRRN